MRAASESRQHAHIALNEPPALPVSPSICATHSPYGRGHATDRRANRRNQPLIQYYQPDERVVTVHSRFWRPETRYVPR